MGEDGEKTVSTVTKYMSSLPFREVGLPNLYPRIMNENKLLNPGNYMVIQLLDFSCFCHFASVEFGGVDTSKWGRGRGNALLGVRAYQHLRVLSRRGSHLHSY